MKEETLAKKALRYACLHIDDIEKVVDLIHHYCKRRGLLDVEDITDILNDMCIHGISDEYIDRVLEESNVYCNYALEIATECEYDEGLIRILIAKGSTLNIDVSFLNAYNKYNIAHMDILLRTGLVVCKILDDIDIVGKLINSGLDIDLFPMVKQSLVERREEYVKHTYKNTVKHIDSVISSDVYKIILDYAVEY